MPTDVIDPLHPYVSQHAARVLADSPECGWAEFDGSLAFFDISGFTTMTERLARLGRAGAEHINDILNLVFQRLIDEVFRFDGDVLEFGGDAMVVLFSGPRHEERAAAATACMFRSMAHVGRVPTSAGMVSLGMSCGIASGRQAYYLLGTTRRALVVAGPISTAMARLEGEASRGEAFVSDSLAEALPRPWVQRHASGGPWRLRFSKVDVDAIDAGSYGSTRVKPPQLDTSLLLPTQFRSLVGVGDRAGELKQVAMSFIRLDRTDDLLADVGADGVREHLAAVTEIVDSTSAAHGVCWLETQAEANSVRWTLIAGAPTATERDGERLLRVVREISDASPFPLRIGANLGVVFVGDMGHPQRCTYIVMGDTTNLAARLMAKAQPGEIIAGERLVATCPSRFELTALEPFTVKGKKLPVRAHLLGALRSGHADVDIDLDADAPILGRSDEIAALTAALDLGAPVELVGDAGVGKTRLWHEARRLTGSDRRWLVIHAEPHELTSPYAPIGRLLRGSARDAAADTDLDAAGSLARLIAEIAPEQLDWLPLIADVAAIEVASTPAVAALDASFRAERLRLAVSDVVLAIAGESAVIVVEDTQWLDEASRSLLETLGRIVGDRVTMLLTRRNDGAPWPDSTSMTIGPIESKSADELLLRELPPQLASDAALTRLKRVASGNPLYLIELARTVATTANRPGEELPESVERLLAARIDRLPIAGRELIRDASVLGSTFDRRLGARVLGRDELDDQATWEREVGDLLDADGDTLRFRHDMVRVAAYEGLSVRRRRAVHRRACAVIEEWGESVPLDDPISALAFHASGSDEPDLVVTWCRRAADAAAARGAMEIAEQMLHDVVQAETRLGTAVADQCETRRFLATAAERAGHPEVSLDALVAAGKMAGPAQRPLIAVDRVRLLEKLGRYRSALLVTAGALRASPPPDVEGQLLLARATIRNFLGEWKECLRLTTELLQRGDRVIEPRVIAQAHLLSEWCCSCLGLPERAAHEGAAMDLLTELDDSIGLGNLFLNRGVSAWRECRVDDAIADFTASSERYRRAGDVLGAALADNNLAEILTLQLQLDRAEELLVHAGRVSKAANYPHGTMATISGLSRIAAWRGDVTLAFELQSEALAGFRSLASDDYVLDSLVRLVELHVIAGDPSAALAVADQASVMLRKLGSVPVLPATLLRLRARALIDQGCEDDARSLLERALQLANDDRFSYEIALITLMLGRLLGDDEQVRVATHELDLLGVLGVPPGC